jgi:hypothetical protein
VSYRTSGVNDTAEAAPVVSIKLLVQHQRCKLHRWCDVILNQVCAAEFSKLTFNSEPTSDKKMHQDLDLTFEKKSGSGYQQFSV